MTLRYSIHYENDVFVRADANLMGILYVGNQRLLEQLELRAAMPQIVKSDVEREADYLNAMRKHIVGTIFEKAAQVDELGVARRLMQWRDALLMAGWDGKCDDANATKLNVLAAIEQDFKLNGNADRWKVVAEAYSKGAILKDMEIEVECPWSELPHLVQLTLEGIERHGGMVRKMKESTEAMSIDLNKVRVVEFSDVNEAYEWIAVADHLPENTLVVNRNNMRLNHILYTWDKPLTAATLHDSNPQLLQLFKLGMSIFSRPLNIHNVVSYLCLPLSPVPAPLRKVLAKLLLEKGGFGEEEMRTDGKIRNEWDEIIEQYEFHNNEGKSTPQARKKKMVFLAPIRNDYTHGISKKEIQNYIDNVLQWINGFGASENHNKEQKRQLHELKSLFNSLAIAIEPKPDIMKYDDIQMLVQSIYRPMNYKVQHMEHGAMNVVADIRHMAQKADNVIWLDCQEEDLEQDTYDFLLQYERKYLIDRGVCLPNFQLHLYNVRQERLRKLNDVAGTVTLVRSAYDGTTRLSEHSLIAEVKHAYKKKHPEKKDSLPIVSKDEILKTKGIELEYKDVETFEPSLSYELGALDSLGRKESGTSIETLINYPFDYVVQYVAKLYQPDEEQVNDTFLTLGIVAHSFFEHIIKDSEGCLDKMRTIANTEFDMRINKAIESTGLILLLPENASNLNNFRKHLKESFSVFIDIMEHLRLKPIGCEIELPDGGELLLEGIGAFRARIDLLLTDENGDYVVFDFKWSNSDTFEKKLKENNSIQLELYRQIVCAAYKDKKVRGVGYYLMPQKKLITCDFKGCKFVKHIDPADTNLFEQIKRSYAFRMEELKRGYIEEGEEIDIKDNENCYYAIQKKENLLYPLKIKEKTSGRRENKQLVYIKKDSNKLFLPSKKRDFNNEDLSPSEIITKNAILKGRLK